MVTFRNLKHFIADKIFDIKNRIDMYLILKFGYQLKN